MNKVINTPHAPAPIGPYSQAIKAGNMLFISGQIPVDPHTNQLVEGNIINETHQVMKNLEAILSAANLDFSHVVKTTIYLSEMALFATVNDVYGSYFTAADFPARETVAVRGLPKGVNVEISMIAVDEP